MYLTAPFQAIEQIPSSLGHRAGVASKDTEKELHPPHVPNAACRAAVSRPGPWS